MKIYFAGSIRAGRDDMPLYANIVALLQQYGTVLTEHVSDPALSSYGEMNLSEEEIFTRDIEWLDSADVIVAEVTTPSLGVGYELGRAEAKSKRVICLYREQEGTRLSAMVAGNTHFKVVTYTKVDELENIFSKLCA